MSEITTLQFILECLKAIAALSAVVIAGETWRQQRTHQIKQAEKNNDFHVQLANINSNLKLKEASFGYQQSYMQELAKMRVQTYLDFLHILYKPCSFDFFEDHVKSYLLFWREYLDVNARANVFISEEIEVLSCACVNKLIAFFESYSKEGLEGFISEYTQLVNSASVQIAIEIHEHTDLESIRKKVMMKHSPKRTSVNQVIAFFRYFEKNQ